MNKRQLLDHISDLSFAGANALDIARIDGNIPQVSLVGTYISGVIFEMAREADSKPLQKLAHIAESASADHKWREAIDAFDDIHTQACKDHADELDNVGENA